MKVKLDYESLYKFSAENELTCDWICDLEELEKKQSYIELNNKTHEYSGESFLVDSKFKYYINKDFIKKILEEGYGRTNNK